MKIRSASILLEIEYNLNVDWPLNYYIFFLLLFQIQWSSLIILLFFCIENEDLHGNCSQHFSSFAMLINNKLILYCRKLFSSAEWQTVHQYSLTDRFGFKFQLNCKWKYPIEKFTLVLRSISLLLFEFESNIQLMFHLHQHRDQSALSKVQNVFLRKVKISLFYSM